MPQTEVRAHRRYLLSRDGDQPSLRAIVDSLADERPTYILATAVGGTEPDLEFLFDNLEEWWAFLEQHWGGLRRTSLSFNRAEVSLHLGWNLEHAEADLMLSSQSHAAVRAALAQLEGLLRLRRIAEGAGRESHGLKRKYFVGPAIDSAWLARLLEAVRAELGPATYVDARLRFDAGSVTERTAADADPPTEQVFRSLESWEAEAAAAWSRLSGLYLWAMARGRRIMVDCDLPRQLVTLEAEGTSNEDVASFLSLLVGRLGLEEAPDDPYKYRRFARSFRILKWKPRTAASFAEAIPEALAKAFQGRPALVSAYVTYGGSAEELERASSIDEFVSLAGDSRADYDYASIYLEGPRGAALGIELNCKEEELRLRSSLDRKTFNGVAEVFENAIDLKLKKDRGSLDDEPAVRPARDGLLAKVLIVLVGLLLSVEFIKAAVPRRSVEITFPAAVEGAASWKSDTLRLHWAVRRSQWWDTLSVAGVEPALLRLLDSTGRVVVEQEHRSGLGLPIQPGDYQVILTLPALSKSASLRLRVEPSAAEQPHAVAGR